MTRRPATLQASLVNEDLYGRQSIPGIRNLVGSRKLRKIQWARNNFVHRVKNGVYDPISHYHVLDELMQLTPYQDFRTVDLVFRLQTSKPQLIWDVVSVGRILTDIVEALHESYGTWPIAMGRRWNGMTFAVSGREEMRILLHRLHDDLFVLCEDVVEAEGRGEFQKRTESPMTLCPSVMDVTTRA